MGFEKLHPAVGFLFLITILGTTMIFMHPILLLMSFFSASIYYSYCKGFRKFFGQLRLVLPFLIFCTVLNPLFNHQGVTVLGYFRENPITVEAVYYGLASAVMLSSIYLWFQVCHHILSSDKTMFLFGRITPVFSLVFSMVLRMVPKLGNQTVLIRNNRKGLGESSSKRLLRRRLRNAKSVMSILITWSLEDSMETAASMKARGYGLKKRTTYHRYKMRPRDYQYCIILFILLVILLSGVKNGQMRILYFPRIRFPETGIDSVVASLTYLFLLNVPILTDVAEDIKWRYLQSRI